jgi:hypothetical protein
MKNLTYFQIWIKNFKNKRKKSKNSSWCM